MGIIVLGGLGAVAIQPTSVDEHEFLHQTLHLSLQDLTIKETDEQYIRVSFSQDDFKFTSPIEIKYNSSAPTSGSIVIWAY